MLDEYQVCQSFKDLFPVDWMEEITCRFSHDDSVNNCREIYQSMVVLVIHCNPKVSSPDWLPYHWIKTSSGWKSGIIHMQRFPTIHVHIHFRESKKKNEDKLQKWKVFFELKDSQQKMYIRDTQFSFTNGLLYIVSFILPVHFKLLYILIFTCFSF